MTEASFPGLGKCFLDRKHFANVYFGFPKKLEKEVMKIVKERNRGC